jgi:hypothetical protein
VSVGKRTTSKDDDDDDDDDAKKEEEETRRRPLPSFAAADVIMTKGWIREEFLACARQACQIHSVQKDLVRKNANNPFQHNFKNRYL